MCKSFADNLIICKLAGNTVIMVNDTFKVGVVGTGWIAEKAFMANRNH